MTRKRRLRGFESTRLGRELAADGIRVARLALPRSALFNRSNAGPLQLVKIRPSSTGRTQAFFNWSNSGPLQLFKRRPSEFDQLKSEERGGRVKGREREGWEVINCSMRRMSEAASYRAMSTLRRVAGS